MKEITEDQYFASGARLMEYAPKTDDKTRDTLERMARDHFWRGVAIAVANRERKEARGFLETPTTEDAGTPAGDNSAGPQARI